MDTNILLTWSQVLGGLVSLLTVIAMITGIVFAVRRSVRKKENAEADLATAQTKKIMTDNLDEPNIVQITQAYQRLMDSHVSTITSHEHTIDDMETRIRSLESEIKKLWKENSDLRNENVKSKHDITKLEKYNKDFVERIENYNREREQTEAFQLVMTTILSNALRPTSLTYQLEKALDALIGMSWLRSFNGCIFLIEDDPEVLVLKAHRGMPDKFIQTCQEVHLGECFCGEAAKKKEAVYYPCTRDHKIKHEGMSKHGHYCIPLLSGNLLIGLVSMYVESTEKYTKLERDYLVIIGKTITDVINFRKGDIKENAKQNEEAT